MFSIEVDLSGIDDYIERETNDWLGGLAQDYSKAMRVFVDRVRSRTKENNESFGNISWNLRSSIGGMVFFNDGTKVTEIDNYYPVLNGAVEGAKSGEKLAREVALLNDEEGIQCVITVGMEYAIFIETIRNIDIITNSSLNFPEDLLNEFSR